MGVIKEWFCGEHGVFEGSHAICPHIGCASLEVVREFRTAPGFRSDTTKRTDAGLKDLATAYGQSDFRSAREGEMSKADNRANEVLWGDQAAQFIGKPLAQAAAPAEFVVKDEQGVQRRWVDRGGLVTAANESKTIHQVLPPAKLSIAGDDKEMRKKLTQ